jgi:transcriptional regulator with XRE-family HTH domain
MTSKRQQQEAAGKWLREARERRGFQTAGALARRMGVSDSLISRYETGVSAVSDDRAEQIAEALGMDLIEVRRGLGLWVPEERPLDEIMDSANAVQDELDRRFEEMKRDPKKRRRLELIIEIVETE